MKQFARRSQLAKVVYISMASHQSLGFVYLSVFEWNAFVKKK